MFVMHARAFGLFSRPLYLQASAYCYKRSCLNAAWARSVSTCTTTMAAAPTQPESGAGGAGAGHASSSSLSAIVAPSMLSSDFADLAAEAKRILECGADWLHMDVMVRLAGLPMHVPISQARVGSCRLPDRTGRLPQQRWMHYRAHLTWAVGAGISFPTSQSARLSSRRSASTPRRSWIATAWCPSLASGLMLSPTQVPRK